MLEMARRHVVQPGAVVVPAAATLYCMGVEALTRDVAGFDCGSVNQFRWDKSYHGVRMASVAHRALTKPRKVLEYFFDGSGEDVARESVVKLEARGSHASRARVSVGRSVGPDPQVFVAPRNFVGEMQARPEGRQRRRRRVNAYAARLRRHWRRRRR